MVLFIIIPIILFFVLLLLFPLQIQTNLSVDPDFAEVRAYLNLFSIRLLNIRLSLKDKYLLVNGKEKPMPKLPDDKQNLSNKKSFPYIKALNVFFGLRPYLGVSVSGGASVFAGALLNGFSNALTVADNINFKYYVGEPWANVSVLIKFNILQIIILVLRNTKR